MSENKELIKVEEFTSIMQSAPASLEANQTSVIKCNSAGQALLDTIEAAGGMTDELDAKVADYLKKAKITVTKMEEKRKPLTQLFDHVRTVFTTLEKNIESKSGTTIPGKLVYLRDQFAAKKLAEEKKRQEEQLRSANAAKEKVTYQSNLELALSTHYNEYFNTKSTELNNLWSSITLDNYDIKAKLIRTFSLVYPQEHFNSFIKDFPTIYIDPHTKGSIKSSVFAGKFESYTEQYRFDMEDLRQSFIDRLSSKHKELKENEELRKVDAQAAAKAEEERKQRDEKARIQRELEAAKKVEEEKANAAAAVQVGAMNSLFETAAATVAPSAPKAKVTEKIKVLHPAAFLEIYQMWWVCEGQQLPIDELEKIHKKMITFCEKKANSEGEHIDSQYIKYVESVKAK